MKEGYLSKKEEMFLFSLLGKKITKVICHVLDYEFKPIEWAEFVFENGETLVLSYGKLSEDIALLLDFDLSKEEEKFKKLYGENSAKVISVDQNDKYWVGIKNSEIIDIRLMDYKQYCHNSQIKACFFRRQDSHAL